MKEENSVPAKTFEMVMAEMVVVLLLLELPDVRCVKGSEKEEELKGESVPLPVRPELEPLRLKTLVVDRFEVMKDSTRVGLEVTEIVGPKPSSPCSPVPNVNTKPLSVTAHVCLYPQETERRRMLRSEKKASFMGEAQCRGHWDRGVLALPGSG